MSSPHNFQQTKKSITSHMKNILNNINSRLNTSTKKLHNFNATLNKFLAHTSSNHLQPHQTTFPLNIFIQNSNESDHMHQSHLSTEYKHDTLKFIASPFRRTNTLTSKTSERYLPISKPTSKNEHKQFTQYINNISINIKRQTHHKPFFIYAKINYIAPHISLFYLFEKITTTYLQTDYHKTTMPPSPINLPASPVANAPTLEKLLPKKNSSRPFSTLKSATDKLFSPRQLQTATVPNTIDVPQVKPEPPATTTLAIDTPKLNYAESITTLPSSIDYSPDTLFVLCQLRRGRNDQVNNDLAKLHNDGSAPTFLETLLTATFLARPTTSTLHSQLRIRQIQYESMKNLTPTYYISFGFLLEDTDTGLSYARYGTPSFTELQEYIHDFVFERRHTTINLDLEMAHEVLTSIFFTIPPCNYPKHKPIAYIAGLPPQVFGRKTYHTQIIIRHLHTILKPLLPGSSLLHNFCYFIQAFGIQVRRNYTFKEGLQEDVYIACVSNTTAHRLLANILFPSQENEHPQLPILNLPVTFIPIPTRPHKSAKVALSRYYQTITTIATTIRTQRTMLETLPFVTTSIFKDPASSSTCKLILDNDNIITYTVLHSALKGINTRIYVKAQDIPETTTDDTVRSWFNLTDHTKLFFPKATKHPPQIIHSKDILQSIVRHLDSSISQYAKAIGYKHTKLTHADKEPNNNKSPMPTHTHQTTSMQTTNNPVHLQSNNTTHTTPTIPQIPINTTPTQPTIVSPTRNERKPPQIPLITDHDNKPTSFTPRKRPAAKSPSPTSDTSSIPSPTPPDNLNPPPEPTETTTNTTTKLNDQLSTQSTSDDSTQSLPNTYSIRVDGIATTLRHSLPETKQPFIDDDEITEKALQVYESTNHTDAIHQAKIDLLLLANNKIKEYKKMRAKKKTKVQSAKKKKKSLKESNPYFT